MAENGAKSESDFADYFDSVDWDEFAWYCAKNEYYPI
jgi:hypothetical protein